MLGGLKEVIKGKRFLTHCSAPNLDSENAGRLYIVHVVELCIIIAQRMKEKYLGSGDNDEERNSTSPSGLQFGQTLESHGPGLTSPWKTP